MPTEIKIVRGDITTILADAIVNAANAALAGGGGVDGAIHKAAGPEMIKACAEIRRRQGGCETGNAVITTGGNLHAKYVIHAVGPVWKNGSNHEDDLLASAYSNSLRIAEEHRLNSIAFPNISTGVYGFPRKRAVEIVRTAMTKLIPRLKSIQTIFFVCYDDENYSLYIKAFSAINP